MLIDMMQNEINKTKTFTENGAVAYETTGNLFTTFLFKVSAYRKISTEAIQNDFTQLYFSDKELALKFLFYIGDVREGLGERRLFRICFNTLCALDEDEAIRVLNFIPEYNRWDSLVMLVDSGNPKVANVVVDIVSNQLAHDIMACNSNKPISLLAKWMPSINTSSAQTRGLANKLASLLDMNPRTYRRTLSKLRAKLKVVERDMAGGKWSSINYEAVPSKANLIYKNAFMRHDAERRQLYLKDLAAGKVKINSSVTFPHEIIHKYDPSAWYSVDYDETYEQLWKALPQYGLEDTLVVRDGSGSMCGEPLTVANALAIYCAEHNNDVWKNKFITFSSRPEVVDMTKCETLKEKLDLLHTYNDYSTTDLYATFKLLLDTALANKLTQDQMPKSIMVISDMQFNGWGMKLDSTLMENIVAEYEANGYKMPRLCFWNVAGRYSNTVPIQKNELGLVLISGFSLNLMKMVLADELDPFENLLKILNSERYSSLVK